MFVFTMRVYFLPLGPHLQHQQLAKGNIQKKTYFSPLPFPSVPKSDLFRFVIAAELRGDPDPQGEPGATPE